MTDHSAKPPRETSGDYRDSVFLPVTDFPMKAGLAQKEPAILARWQGMDLYRRLRESRAGRDTFIFHDGPPYANGDIHIGHALNKTLKDLVVRTQSLRGKDAPFVPGWDCHGLPIEWKIEEQYRKAKRNKDEVPAREFRAECRAYAQHWVGVQREQFKRLGILAQWDHPYLTMSFAAEAAIVAELLKFAEAGQLYRGAKPVMWSPVEKTALAEAEVEYHDVTSTEIDVAFEITEAPNAPELVGAHAVIWTTTPWTIPVNQAIAYGADVDYVAMRCGNRVILTADNLWNDFAARANASPWLSQGDGWSVVWAGKGSQLSGAKARHPMAHLASPLPNPSPGGEGLAASPNAEFFARPRPFLDGSHFVTTDAGTGLVHMAPDHGEDDFELCKANGLSPVFAVEGDGQYRADWAWLPRGDERSGSVINKKFTASDGPICTDLRAAGALLSASDNFQHSYPHSWRSKARVIYRCTPQWFVPMDVPLNLSSPRRGEEGAPSGTEGEGAPKADAAGHPHPTLSLDGEGSTLRAIALDAVRNRVRFVPERGKRRLEAMLEGRPDWVLSRQRAWGVPIALYVHRQSGQYLRDPAVNARIIAAFHERGADAWFDADHQALLGADHDLADYEVVTDILDVWFDSGSTHAFVLEGDEWPDHHSPADLYLEGSDQHRGWFQSSLLESCGTRGRAPYKALLTHGMTLDAKGLKMSKSVGNTLDPDKVIQVYGADILRLWAASVDFTEDHRIGDEILKGVADQYRKLRNTFRYLLGALADFDPAERVDYAAMPELERYVLHRLAEVDAELKQAVDDFAFGRYVRALSNFAQDDLSAFFFDIRKDCLYCDVGPALPQGTDKRRAYRTVLDILFEALVRYAAPVLVFTAEEAWQTRYPDPADSVHLKEWPEIDPRWTDIPLAMEWSMVRLFRDTIVAEVEPLRREKAIRSSLEADVRFRVKPGFREKVFAATDLAELAIVASAELLPDPLPDDHDIGFAAEVTPTTHHKCGRCWRHLPEVAEDGALCDRCAAVLG